MAYFENIAVAKNEQEKLVCLRFQPPRGVVHSGYYFVAVDSIPTNNDHLTFEDAAKEFAHQCSI